MGLLRNAGSNRRSEVVITSAKAFRAALLEALLRRGRLRRSLGSVLLRVTPDGAARLRTELGIDAYPPPPDRAGGD